MGNLLAALMILCSLAVAWCGIFDSSRQSLGVYSADNIPASELNALQDLYNATHGADWTWGQQPGVPWNFTAEANPCLDMWEGVSCSATPLDGNLHVESLQLSQYNLAGSLTPSIGNLTQLMTLNLTGNSLSAGPLPDTLGKLLSLRALALGHCQISGLVPSSMQNLLNLTFLELGNNRLSGSAYTVTCHLTSLQYLSLSYNDFSGSIPACIGNMTSLYALNVEYNNFAGVIPESIGNLQQLRYLALGFCAFTGSIPNSLSSMTQLRILQLESNIFTGTFPSFLTGFIDLETLSMSENFLDGTVPYEIGSLVLLRTLGMQQNYFTGTLPASLAQLTAMEVLNVQLNYFTGTLPQGLAGMNNLRILIIAFNELSGTIPAGVFSQATLYHMLIEQNFLSGTIADEISPHSALQNYFAGRNLLSGTLPRSLLNAQRLAYLELSQNQLTGSIPSVTEYDQSALFFLSLSDNFLTGPFPEFGASCEVLAYINVSGNSITGTLPASLGNLSALDIVYAYSNKIGGSLPDTFGELPRLSFLILGDNLLTGTIPSSLGDVFLLQSLNLSSNFLTGTIPDELSHLRRLSVLLLMDNELTGRVDTMLDVNRQQNLTTLQLSNNQLTGTLPDYLSEFPLLNVFAAVSNCFTGSIPLSLCDSESLITLALDGLQTATSCQRKLFSSTLEGTIVADGLYSIRRPLSGGVPACLFSMASLTTLHLSGNGLTGTLPDDVEISPSLTDLSLSHNKLTGGIPATLLGRDWHNLDLSYNRFTGSIESTSGADGRNSSSVIIDNNRLSGAIPGYFTEVASVDILESNLFSCQADRSDLPRSDPNHGKYDCASTNFDDSLYAWLAVLATTLGLIVVLWLASNKLTNSRLQEMTENLRKWFKCGSDGTIALCKVATAADHVVRMGFTAMVYIVLVLLPIYAVCSTLYGTYTHQYAYVLSAAYLSGPVPFAWEFVFLLLLLIVTITVVLLRAPKASLPAPADDAAAPRSSAFCVYALTVALNFAVVLGVNTAYVIVVLNRNGLALTFTQIALALFKVAFNGLCSPALLRWTSQRFAGRQPSPSSFITVQLLVSIVNNILVPCLVVSIISPDCFYNVFKAAAKVEAQFNYEGKCLLFYTAYHQIICTEEAIITAQTSYSPPFDYSYQCSSSFITYYAPAYVIMCIIAGFALPVAQVVLQRLHARAAARTRWFAVLDMVLPRVLKPMPLARNPAPEVDTLAVRNVFAPVFDASQHLITLLTYLALTLTFGAVFPPLAVCFAVTIVCMIVFTKLKVGRFLVNAREANQPGQVAIVEQECAGVGEPGILVRAVSMIAVSAGVFYTLFLFDTLGDRWGLSRAYWVLIVTPLLAPFALCVAHHALRHRTDGTSLPPLMPSDTHKASRDTEVELSSISGETVSPLTHTASV